MLDLIMALTCMWIALVVGGFLLLIMSKDLDRHLPVVQGMILSGAFFFVSLCIVLPFSVFQ